MGTLQNIFSEQLMALCQLQNETISKVASDLGINRQQFARYLNGKAIPREATIERFAEYFNVHPTYFFTDTAPENETASKEASKSVEIMFDILRNAKATPVTPDDLTPGLYTLKKCSFTSNGRFIKSVFQVKYVDGVSHYKALVYRSGGRGYKSNNKNTIVANSLGTDRGVFLKTNGKLIMVNEGTTTGHSTVHVFLHGHELDFNIKPGVHMTIASSIASGVRSAICVLRKIPPDENVLQHARTIGWIDRSAIGDIELDVLSGGTFENTGIIGV